jgi:hypothetical protein
MCRLSRKSRASASWNPKGLSRPVAGKLYLLLPVLKQNIHSLVTKIFAFQEFFFSKLTLSKGFCGGGGGELELRSNYITENQNLFSFIKSYCVRVYKYIMA